MRLLLVCLSALLIAGNASAYELLLDIDLDDDPATLNTLTWDTSALVTLILNPTEPGESIERVDFGLGGSCRECDHVHMYGTAHDLIDWVDQNWIQANGWTSGWDGITHLGCAGDVSYHEVLWGEPVNSPLVLGGPVVLAEFNVWIADPVPPGCIQPPANLGCFGPDGLANYVQIGGPALENDTARWGAIKALYR